MALALLLMVTRVVDARGGDLLSILLGRHAWAIVGRPNRGALSAGAASSRVAAVPTPAAVAAKVPTGRARRAATRSA
jgi:hypothetical protein